MEVEASLEGPIAKTEAERVTGSYAGIYARTNSMVTTRDVHVLELAETTNIVLTYSI